jgi:hypothetical protein
MKISFKKSIVAFTAMSSAKTTAMPSMTADGPASGGTKPHFTRGSPMLTID